MKSIDPDGVTTLMAYNDRGEQTTTATDLNRNGTINYGSDTVQFSETIPALYVSSPVWKTVTQVWKPGATINQGTTTSTNYRRADGLFSASQTLNSTGTSTSLTTLSGNGNWTSTSTSPDGTNTVGTYTAGKMVSTVAKDTNGTTIQSQSQGYDVLNRPTTSTHSRTGVTTTAYLSTTADVVKSTTDPGNRTTNFTYDIRGRQISVNAPDTVDAQGATLTNVTTTSYNPDGTVQETSGAQTYRTTHTYDYAQRMVSMTTYGTATATTTWNYSENRGFLLSKRDAANKGATYTYTAAGRLLSRKWERGITTIYGYDNGGRMTSTNYSDTTPDVAMSYDSLNRPITQSNGQATSTFAYDTDTLAVDTETITYDLNTDGTPELTRVIDRSRDNLLRDTGFQLKNSAVVENQATYGYHATDGRLENVANPSASFTYGYEPNSYGLIKTITSPIHTVTNTYEATRDVLATKENKAGTTLISKYAYTVNDLGQRTNLAQTGTAFDTARTVAWGYDPLGQVTQADSSIATQDRAYAFDLIGNRLKTADSLTLPTLNNYTPNALNQYTAIDALNPVHDADGNMTSGSLPANVNANSTLVWDGENRLIEAQVSGGGTVTYLYDRQSRRIATISGAVTTLAVYDGWNPIAEYSISNNQYSISQSFTWGMDLSGTMQGAGGVGGLLAVTDSTGTYFPTYDGNGNISEYINSIGAVVAHYEYDPFGKTTVAIGSKANDFVHRFSTKPLDATTGLYYYGYRYYDPNTGRWPSRDPIEEAGGLNLYGFVGNDGVNWVDVFGLEGALPSSDDLTKKKCNVVLEIDHTFASDVAFPSQVHKCSRYGFLGCGDYPDTFNEDFNLKGRGIPGLPKIGGEFLSGFTTWKKITGTDFNGNSTYEEEPLTDEITNGPNYGAGKMEFTRLLNDAWKASIAEAGRICIESNCCKKIRVTFLCGSGVGFKGAEKIMGTLGMAKEWCGKTTVLDCKKVNNDYGKN